MFVALAILLLSAEDLNANDCGQELCPAHISPHKTTVFKGDPLQITCFIKIPAHKSGEFTMYLCKDGRGIQMSKGGSNFTVETPSSDESGSYSCVYSTFKLDRPRCSSNPAANKVHITVSGKSQELCLPARISPHKTEVLKGDPLEITCSVKIPEHKSGEFTMYLCKDGLGIKMSPTKDGRNFTLETASSDVSGYYSCAYSAAKMANATCCSEPAADQVYIKVFDPKSSGSSGGLAAVTVIFLIVLAALLGYQHRNRLKHLIWSDRGRQRQGGTHEDHIPAGGTEQQHQSMATYQDIAEYSTISDRQGQTRASVVSAIDTVYSTVQYEDQVAEEPTYGKVNKKRKTKKPKEVTDAYALADLP